MLSNREAEILQCLMQGAPNKIIARQLDVAEATVKVHVKAILRKIQVANRTQAAMWAVEHLSSGRRRSWDSASSDFSPAAGDRCLVGRDSNCRGFAGGNSLFH